MKRFCTTSDINFLHRGLSLYESLNKHNDDFEVVLSGKKNGIIDDNFICMSVDHEDVVWLGTNNGLYNFKNNIWRVLIN